MDHGAPEGRAGRGRRGARSRALLQGLVQAAPGTKVVCVLSGGNINLDQLKGLRWN